MDRDKNTSLIAWIGGPTGAKFSAELGARRVPMHVSVMMVARGGWDLYRGPDSGCILGSRYSCLACSEPLYLLT